MEGSLGCRRIPFEPEGHGAVVVDLHLHHRAKLAGGDGDTFSAEEFNEAIVQDFSLLRTG